MEKKDRKLKPLEECHKICYFCKRLQLCMGSSDYCDKCYE